MSAVTTYFTEDEFDRGKRLLLFLKKLAGNRRYMSITWEELTKMSSAILGVEAIDAYWLIKKMEKVGWISFDGDLLIIKKEASTVVA